MQNITWYTFLCLVSFVLRLEATQVISLTKDYSILKQKPHYISIDNQYKWISNEQNIEEIPATLPNFSISTHFFTKNSECEHKNTLSFIYTRDNRYFQSPGIPKEGANIKFENYGSANKSDPFYFLEFLNKKQRHWIQNILPKYSNPSILAKSTQRHPVQYLQLPLLVFRKIPRILNFDKIIKAISTSGVSGTTNIKIQVAHENHKLQEYRKHLNFKRCGSNFNLWTIRNGFGYNEYPENRNQKSGLYTSIISNATLTSYFYRHRSDLCVKLECNSDIGTKAINTDKINNSKNRTNLNYRIARYNLIQEDKPKVNIVIFKNAPTLFDIVTNSIIAHQVRSKNALYNSFSTSTDNKSATFLDRYIS